MQLSVIILNYNVSHFLELCLQSVQAALQHIDGEIIVVDNASTDNSCEMIRQKFPKIRLIENTSNYGFSKGNNIGVSHASGEFICILNPDTVVSEDTFIKIYDFAINQENLGAIGCQLIDGRGRFLPESKRNVPVVKVALEKILGRTRSYYATNLNTQSIGKVDILVGAFMFMKKEVYENVNGFDEDYFMYGEDVDLSYRLLKNNLENFYFGDTTVIHFKGESTLKDEKYAKRFFGAMQIFYRKHFKRNIIFDTMVHVGILFARVFKSSTQIKQKTPERYFLFTDRNSKNILDELPFDVTPIDTTSKITNNSEIIFNANTMTFNSIINMYLALHKNKSLTFKIFPKNGNYIIGSNHSKFRGEIIQF